VAASKMKADLGRLEAGKEFGFGAIDKVLKSDLYMQRKTQGLTVGSGKTVIVPITSDRGLCGGINSGIVREIKTKIIQSQNKSLFSIVTIGEKGTSALLRPFPDLMRAAISEVHTPLNYPTISSIGQQIASIASGSDKIVVFYNEFKSAIKTIIKDVELIPREKFAEMMKYKRLYKPSKLPVNRIIDPTLYDLYISSNLYTAYLNNLASEQSARMTAMENASKNAKELVEKLKLEYNKARQARITMELVEIISGASVV
jgi:F-type H+-transporting ATPase subunit gamma